MNLKKSNSLELEKTKFWGSYPNKYFKEDFLDWLSRKNFQIFIYNSFTKTKTKKISLFLVKQGTYRPVDMNNLSKKDIFFQTEFYDNLVRTDNNQIIKALIFIKDNF